MKPLPQFILILCENVVIEVELFVHMLPYFFIVFAEVGQLVDNNCHMFLRPFDIGNQFDELPLQLADLHIPLLNFSLILQHSTPTLFLPRFDVLHLSANSADLVIKLLIFNLDLLKFLYLFVEFRFLGLFYILYLFQIEYSFMKSLG